MAYQRVALECSLKPFVDCSPEGIRGTCQRIWKIWQPLIEQTSELAVQLWVGSGDEILTWTGQEDQPLPWANNIGFNNYQRKGAYDPKNRHYRLYRSVPYLEHPPELRFGDLRDIIRALRQTAMESFGRPISVGATLDPGPEFVDSPFRYEAHREILTPRRSWMKPSMEFITHQSTLRADGVRYGGFPDGMNQDVSFGQFLGRQFDALRKFAGFDFLWFSNGLGYSHFPWNWRGELMDGVSFHPERAAEQVGRLLSFWQDFRAACPETAVEVRGTNYSLGMDLATDGCLHTEVAAIARLARPPCNPPWGSRTLGLEMVSYLSRIAAMPRGRIPMRFYLNDPWFVSRPWYDYYGREPFDIYVPAAASRLNAGGGVDVPIDLNLLSIDSSYGELDHRQAIEVIPHLLEAGAEQADAAGPVIWVYPAMEYEQVVRDGSGDLPQLFAQDWFMTRAVDCGFPLGMVCPSTTFVQLHKEGRLPQAVYVAPVPLGPGEYADALMRHVRQGGTVMLYGALGPAPAELLKMLSLKLGEPIEGDLLVSRNGLEADRFAGPAEAPLGADPTYASIGMKSVRVVSKARGAQRPLRHRAIASGGGLCEIASERDAGVRLAVGRGIRRRVCAVSRAQRAWGGGRLLWVRGTVTFDPALNWEEPAWDPPHAVVQAAEWARFLLAETGIHIVQERSTPATRPAYVFIRRTAGAWVFVGHKPDTSVRFFVRFPWGAPVYEEQETPIVNGYAGESFGKTFCRTCRAFVDGMKSGVVAVKRLKVPMGKKAHFSITGLRNATVTIYPDPKALAKGTVEIRPELRLGRIKHAVDRRGGTIRVNKYSGSIYVMW